MNVWQRQEGVLLYKERLGREGLVKYLTLCKVMHGSLQWKAQQILNRVITSIYNSDTSIYKSDTF